MHRITLILLLALLLPDLYIYLVYIVRRTKNFAWRAAFWLPSAVLVVLYLYLIYLTGDNALAHHPQAIGRPAIAVMALAVPKILFMLCSLLGILCRGLGRCLSAALLHTPFRKPQAPFIVHRTPFTAAGLVLGVVSFVNVIYGATAGITRFQVKHVTYESERLPEGFDGYRIALFTDLHTGTQPRNRRLIRRMVALINREHPDMVVNAGDLVNIDSHELDDRVMSILSTLHGRDGVYSVLGNHDLGFYMRPKENFTPRQSVEELLAKQRAMGWKPLVNESAPIRRGADSILVTGVNFPETGTNHGRDTGMAGCDMQEVFRSVPPDTYNLLLAHTPEQWDEARSAGDPDLTLSGHVHAMQFKLTLGPWSWSPAKFLYERWSGLYSENGKYLYINDGMGYVMYPMRIGTNPSITVITLESEKRR